MGGDRSRFGRARLGAPRLLAGAFAVLVATLVVPQASLASGAQFGSEGEGAGQLTRALAVGVDNGNPLESPSAGDVYVADAGNNRVDKFSSSGEFMLSWGWGVADGKTEEELCGPVASPATSSCQAGIEGAGAGAFSEPEGVVVDTAGGLSHGDVYVEDRRNNRIEKFGEGGDFLLAWGWGVADGKEEPEQCGPESGSATCLAGLEGMGAGEFESLAAGTIAVASTGDVLVGDGKRVEKFSENGQFEGEVALVGSENEVDAVGLDPSGDIYAVRSEFGVPGGLREYDNAGAEVAALDPAAGIGTAIALDATGNLVEDTEGRITEFEPGGSENANFPGPQGATGIAFDEQLGELYVLTESKVIGISIPPPGPLIESASAVSEPVGTATITASIDPEGLQATYRLEYGPEVGSPSATEATVMAAEGFQPEVVQIHISGLLAKTRYHYHLIAESAAGSSESSTQTFTTLPAVAIDSESVSQVSARSARFGTTLNPLTLATRYRFEYGTSTSYGSSIPVPDGSAGAGRQDVSFSALIEGLEPGTTYHYRVVAQNSFGEERGTDHVFTTQTEEGPGSTAKVIDGRGWELVSPPDKHGSALEAITREGGLIQAAMGGAGLAYIAKAPVDSTPAGNRSFAEQQLLATRGAEGWKTADIGTAHEAVAGLRGGELSEYRQFSPDLSAGIVEPAGATPLSPWATERTPYIRESSGEYLPLVTGCPAMGEACPSTVEEHADVPPGTKFGGNEENGRLQTGTGAEFKVAAPDLAHVLITAPESLVSGFENEGHTAVYEWNGGHSLQPVSVLPGGAPVGPTGAAVGQANEIVRNALSVDGNHAFFESAQHLYARDLLAGQSVQLDSPEEGVRAGNGEAGFQYATPDGADAFFTDAANLTHNATGRQGKRSLYLCELAGSVDESSCAAKHALKDLTVGEGGEAADVRGAVIGFSEQGSYAYFVANGRLTNNGVPVAGAIQGDCEVQEEGGECNLYLWHEGVTSLVAVLAGGDAADWKAETGADLSTVTARVSPNGQYLAFMSAQPLTGYDNHDASSGMRDAEVFLYDAASGRLICASCDPTGARPTGVLEPNRGTEPTSLVDRVGAWSTHWVAGSIPGWTPVKSGAAIYQSRYLSNEGRLFFDSPGSLVPHDDNSQQDVYEYEPAGVGACSTHLSDQTSIFVGAVEGCVGLISSGTSSEESAFLDATGMGPGGLEGEEVFFLTSARLAPADSDRALDVYDAHVCISASPCPVTSGTVTPPGCGESCQLPSTAPSVVAPASTSPSGEGNVPPPRPSKPLTRAQKLTKALRTCRTKHNRKKRKRCERAARAHYGPPRSNTKTKQAFQRSRKS
jgi:hypothetical protein